MDREKRVKSIRNWIAGADYDLDTAKHMLKTGRFLYVVFMCHLTLEKALKAHVELHEDKFPPKIHDLIRLADRAGLEIPEDLNCIVLELNQASIPTRYPEDLQQSLTVYTNDYAAKVLQETEEVLQWLKAHPRIAML